MRDLARELGEMLFDRDSRGVHLAAAGTALLPIARDLLRRFDDLPCRSRRETGSGRSTVYIGIPPGPHPRLRELLTRLERDCASTSDLKRWPGHTRDLFNAVQRGALAMAFAHLSVHADRVEVHEVMREPLCAVLPAEEFAGRDSVPPSALADCSYANPAPGMLPTCSEQRAVRLPATGSTSGATCAPATAAAAARSSPVVPHSPFRCWVRESA